MTNSVQMTGHSLGALRIRYPVVGSTMTVAERLARQGAPHGTVVLAEVQTRGRGRQGRPWRAESGSALLSSWVLRLAGLPGDISALSPLVALAVVHAIRKTLPEAPVALKWPNDVLAAGRKVAGILLTVHGAPGERVVIAGIGINIGLAAIPAGMNGAALEEWCEGISSPILLNGLADELDIVLRGFIMSGCIGGDERTDIESSLAWWGERVTVIADHGSRDGVIRGIDENGSLLLEAQDGRIQPVRMGEVVRGPRLRP